MIESCTRKRMVIAIVFLIVLSVIVVIIENEWTPDSNHRHTTTDFNSNLTEEDCWINEEFSELEECQPCSDLELSSKLKPCDIGKYRQKINCSKTGIVKRKCDRVVWLEERQFILFEFLMLIMGMISGTYTFYRQKILDDRIYQRIQKQVAAGV